jgi:hypothetical protein
VSFRALFIEPMGLRQTAKLPVDTENPVRIENAGLLRS